MEEIKITPPDESEQETPFGKIFLRVGAMFLCAIVGIALILLGYLAAIVIGLDLETFNNYTASCFITSILIWVIIGLVTPFYFFQRFFEAIREVSAIRVLITIAIFIFLIFFNWFVVNIISEML